ncbi:hypothetical protein C5613_29775 [Rhodococcus opacus]|uniref:Uncharacterized protein n=1 Tax=Rhodococcus opacus TaxID=37919 RepID=A0A2S8IYD2_RHOOP|nr:hypothetical protein C5613_29775 [Rhodococcus opacus]
MRRYGASESSRGGESSLFFSPQGERGRDRARREAHAKRVGQAADDTSGTSAAQNRAEMSDTEPMTSVPAESLT